MHRAGMTLTRLINWIKGGRGQGFGKDYRPFLQITKQDHASVGQSHIVPNQFLQRQHHLLSTLERQICMMNLLQPCVTDLREQYPQWTNAHTSPLFDLYEHKGLELPGDKPRNCEGTVAIARRLGIKHERFVGLHVPYLYTTDQLVTLEWNSQPPKLVAIAIKYWADLRDRKNRTSLFKKLRLERAYWRGLGIDWLLLTDRQLNPQVVSNLEFLLSAVIRPPRHGDHDLLSRFVMAFEASAWTGRCLEHMEILARALNITRPDAIHMLKLAVWRRLIPVDVSKPISLTEPLPMLSGMSKVDTWSPLHRFVENAYA